MTKLTEMPPELIHKIALTGYLTPPQVAALSQTCHHMASILVWDEYGNNIHHALNGVLPNVKAHNWKAAHYAITRRWFAADDNGEEGVWKEVAEAVVERENIVLDNQSDLTAWEDILLATLSLPQASWCLDVWRSHKAGLYTTSLLHVAAKAGSQRLVEWVAGRGGLFDLRNHDNESPLFDACANGNLPVVLQLIEGGADVLATNNWEKGVLHAASEGDSPQLVRHLLGLGLLDVDQEDLDRETPLCTACMFGRVGVVKVLVQEGGADVDPDGSLEYGPLFHACREGHLDVARVLVDAGTLSRVPHDAPAWTKGLVAAARKGSLDIVQHLLDLGVAVNGVGEEDNTALVAASQLGHLDVVHLLVTQWGADVNKAGRRGKTPLHWACQNGDEDMVTVLLGAGAGVRIADGYGVTPLDVASEKGWEPGVHLLLATSPP